MFTCRFCGVASRTWAWGMVHIGRCRPSYLAGLVMRIAAPILLGAGIAASAWTTQRSGAGSSTLQQFLVVSLLASSLVAVGGWLLMRRGAGDRAGVIESSSRGPAVPEASSETGVVAFVRQGGWRFILALIPAAWLLAWALWLR